jgi:hypothetical protein
MLILFVTFYSFLLFFFPSFLLFFFKQNLYILFCLRITDMVNCRFCSTFVLNFITFILAMEAVSSSRPQVKF